MDRVNVIEIFRDCRVLLLIIAVIAFKLFPGLKKKKDTSPTTVKHLSPEELNEMNGLFSDLADKMAQAFGQIDSERDRYPLSWRQVEKWEKQLQQVEQDYESMKTELTLIEAKHLSDNLLHMLLSGQKLIEKGQNPYDSGLLNEEPDAHIFGESKK